MSKEQEKKSELFIERPDSVEISINAKGHYSAKIKAYASTIDEAMRLSLAKAKELEIIIKERNTI